MKNFKHALITLVILLLIFNCVKIDDIEFAEQKVSNSLDQFYNALEKQDLNRLMSLFLQGPNTVMIFPEPEGKVVGTEEIQQRWQQIFADVSSIKTFRSQQTVQVHSNIHTAWTSSVNKVEIVTEEGVKIINVVVSAVLEERANQWLFTQVHFSIPPKEKLTEIVKPEAIEESAPEKEPTVKDTIETEAPDAPEKQTPQPADSTRDSTKVKTKSDY